MKLPRHVRLALALLAIAAGLYAGVYSVAGENWFKMSKKDLSPVEGCYAIAGQQLFKISGRTLFTTEETFGFEASHEKDRDVLVLDGPVRVAVHPQLRLRGTGTSTMVPISYKVPMRLELWDENNRRIEAIRTDCRP